MWSVSTVCTEPMHCTAHMLKESFSATWPRPNHFPTLFSILYYQFFTHTYLLKTKTTKNQQNKQTKPTTFGESCLLTHHLHAEIHQDVQQLNSANQEYMQIQTVLQMQREMSQWCKVGFALSWDLVHWWVTSNTLIFGKWVSLRKGTLCKACI